MTTHFKTRCPHCHSMNKVPVDRLSESPQCGQCKHDLVDGNPIEGTLDNFDILLNQSQIPVVVDFWAPWCNPCVGFAPTFEKTAQDKQRQIRFVKIDTDAQQELAERFQIRSIPTIMVFHHGKHLQTIHGALPYSKFNQWLEQTIS